MSWKYPSTHLWRSGESASEMHLEQERAISPWNSPNIAVKVLGTRWNNADLKPTFWRKKLTQLPEAQARGKDTKQLGLGSFTAGNCKRKSMRNPSRQWIGRVVYVVWFTSDIQTPSGPIMTRAKSRFWPIFGYFSTHWTVWGRMGPIHFRLLIDFTLLTLYHFPCNLKDVDLKHVVGLAYLVESLNIYLLEWLLK
jgi:hypothetical protein